MLDAMTTEDVAAPPSSPVVRDPEQIRRDEDAAIVAHVGPRKARELRRLAEQSPAHRAALIREGRSRQFAKIFPMFVREQVQPRRAPEHLYFIQVIQEGEQGGPIKIGCAVDLDRRIATLQTASPYELSLVGVIEHGATQERELHRRFAHLHLRGEWFRAGADLCGYIWALPRPSAEFMPNQSYWED